jgi:hypothetical protein
MYVTVTQGLPDAEPIIVYPNPNNGSFSLQIDEGWALPLHVSIQDYAGRVVDQRIQSDKPLDSNIKFELINLTPGLYILRVYSGEQQYTRKFVLQ